MTAETIILAWCLFLECGGEPAPEILRVATVIHNRRIERGLSYAQVVRQPWQFSAFNRGQVGWRLARKQRLRASELEQRKWQFCLITAQDMISGEFQPLGPWNHYHRTDTVPRWSWAMRDRKLGTAHWFGRIE